MPELQAELCARVRMDEVDDALPCVSMLVTPHSGAPGADAALRGNAGHLREEKPRSSQSAFAIMNQMEVIRPAFERGIGCHGRDCDAILQFQVAEAKGRKHRRSRLAQCSFRGTLPEPPLDGFEPCPVPQPQIL